MRIEVDLDLCQGHAVCQDEAPAVFTVPKNDQVELLRTDPAADIEAVRDAVRYCPTQALSIVEDDK